MESSRRSDAEIFTEALNLPKVERAQYLARACGNDIQLRKRVDALLNANEEIGEFLETPVREFPFVKRTAGTGGAKPGDRIGHFKLLEQIGEGGWGVVFLAEQEKPIRRHVALKIVKPGMDTKAVIARFEAERQTLSLMDHPNIAKVFDAGETESGHPYFVMELIRGVKITDYCNANSLSAEGKLELFVQVCHAVQHAHQKGIIHRDIKPSNILVTTEPGEKPTPKVIDFGIAKATVGQRLTDKTIFTAFELLIGTPAYMSPEQATLSSSDIDTRTDIYSLGVLLYELLTGTTPFDSGELLKAGIDEIRRVIRDEDPVPPSTRLSQVIAKEPQSQENRPADAPRLIRQMRGDLDWIVMNALEKDRTRRYPTASGLATDIKRYLSGEAVSARPPSFLYKASKLIKRNKVLCISLGIIFLLLIAGLAVTIRLLVVEKQRRELAQRQREVYRLEGLGIGQWVQGKKNDAEDSFRHSFKIRDAFLRADPPNVMVAAFLADILNEKNKHQEAVDFLLVQLPKIEPSAAPAYASILSGLAKTQATKGQWKEAAFTVKNIIPVAPDRYGYYHMLAPLLVIIGDVPEYQRLCGEIVRRFGDTQDIFIADQMAKDCLILPGSGADLKVVGAMANLAVTRGTNQSSFSLFQCCKALAEYRQEHFADAAQWARSAVTNSFPYSRAEGNAVLAMALYKSGQTNDARAALNETSKVIAEKFPKQESGDLGSDWRDWIVAHALQKEANTLINPKKR